MAVILVDGFDLYNGTGANTGVQAKWSAGIGSSSYSLVAGRFGGQALRIAGNASGSATRRSFTANASVGIGMGFRGATMPSANPGGNHFLLESAGTAMCGFRVTSAGAIEVGRYTSNTASTVLGTSSAGVIVSNTWHYVEVEVTISDTVGVFKVYVDGVQVLNLTAQDTRNGAPTTVDTIRIGPDAAATTLGTFDYDDIYVVDAATKLGERRVETLYPTSDVAQGFARSTGATNYTLVDEAQVNGDTDYVQASSVSTVDTYGFGDLTGTPGTIDAVQFSCFAEKTDATARSIALQAISGATTSDGSNFSLAASYSKFERLMLTDPNGSIAWTAASVNALTGGPKVTV